MAEKNSTADGNFSSGQTNKEVSATSKGAVGRRRADISLVQNVLLIWLDNNIDEESKDCRNTLTQLRRVINAINTFTDRDQCIDFLTDNYNVKVLMIISGELAQYIVPLIHDVTQLNSIFIFCSDRKQHEQWAKQWPKIKGVFTEISPIYEALKDAAQQCEHNAIGISFMSMSSEASNTNLEQLDCSFMYTQILKEILLEIPFEQEHIKEFTDYCAEVFDGNDHELNNVYKLERTYHEKTPIWWYTFECFLYPMLNRALRTMEINMIIMMGFFVSDLHRHIERLHTEQFGTHPQSRILTAYRGQGLSHTDFDQMAKTKGGLMAFNNFLSTSQNRNISFSFARKASSNPDMVGILFVMSIDPSESTTPFVSINGISYFKGEDEILFSMHTVFRIRDIKSIGENNRLWQVELTLTNDNDKDLRVLTEHIRENTEGFSGWYRLGSFLLDVGQSDKAQQVYDAMLEQTSNDHEKKHIYDQIGHTRYDQGQYEEAIIFLEQSLEIKQRTLPPTHPDLAMSYHHFGTVYRSMGENFKALLYYERALEIQRKTLSPTHLHLSILYHNIGTVYGSMGEYSKAISYYNKGLDIQQKSLPPTHPDLAKSYICVGNVYSNMDEHTKALSYYQKALEIQQKTLPPIHPDLAMSYGNIGNLYFNMGEYSKAHSYYDKGLDIQQKTLPPTHRDLAKSYVRIGIVCDIIREHSKARSFFERAVDIG